MQDGQAALCVEDVSFSYGNTPAPSRLSFAVPPGRVTMLLGPDGAGKTTLFSLIARQLPLTRGRIRICGRDLAESGADIIGEVTATWRAPVLTVTCAPAGGRADHRARARAARGGGQRPSPLRFGPDPFAGAAII
jgi:ABC-2 type transport system ATP-binding protein